MSSLDVYIGDLDHPKFSWDGGNWSGNTPKVLSKFFPPVPGSGWECFFAVIDGIEKGQYEGKQVDWGAWVAKVNKKQIETFITKHYHDGMYGEHFPHLQQKLDELRTFVQSLKEDKLYALVASEL